MDPEPTPALSRPVLDPVNTAAWLTMDALWLARLTWPAYVAAGLTVLTGLLVLVLGRRRARGELFADLGLNCWILMNTIWLAHDLSGRDTPRAVAAVLGGLGAVCLLAAARHSQDLRRVRILRR